MNELSDCCIEMRRCSDALSVFFYMSLTISDTVGKMIQSHHASSRGASPMNFQDRRLPSARTRESISWTRECKPDQSSTATELNCRTWTARWKLHGSTGFLFSMRSLLYSWRLRNNGARQHFNRKNMYYYPFYRKSALDGMNVHRRGICTCGCTQAFVVYSQKMCLYHSILESLLARCLLAQPFDVVLRIRERSCVRKEVNLHQSPTDRKCKILTRRKKDGHAFEFTHNYVQKYPYHYLDGR